MSFQRIKKVNLGKLDRIGLVTLLTAALGFTGILVPLQVQAAPINGSLEVGSSTSGNCIQASGVTSGSSAVLSTCNGKINQKWYINNAGYYNGKSAYDIETAKAGSFMCLNDMGNSTAPAAPVNLENCNGINSAQRFVWVNNNQLFNIASGECLDSSTVGAQLVLNSCVPSANSQMWFLTPNSAKP